MKVVPFSGYKRVAVSFADVNEVGGNLSFRLIKRANRCILWL